MLHKIQNAFKKNKTYIDSKLIWEDYQFHINGISDSSFARLHNKGITIIRPWKSSLFLQEKDISDVSYFIDLYEKHAKSLSGLIYLSHLMEEIIEFYPANSDEVKIIFQSSSLDLVEYSNYENSFEYKKIKELVDSATYELSWELSDKLTTQQNNSANISRCILSINLYAKNDCLKLILEENARFKELINIWKNKRKDYSPSEHIHLT